MFLASEHQFDFGSKSSISGNLKCSHMIANHASNFLSEIDPRTGNHGHSYSAPFGYPVGLLIFYDLYLILLHPYFIAHNAVLKRLRFGFL